MKTDVLTLDPTTPDPAAVRRAAAVIRAGGLVAFPTETVYGLGANALDPAAVGRVFAAKGRPATNPVIVHVADAADVLNVAADWPATAAALAARFWPGPLTLVLPRRPEVPDGVTAGGPTVAVRCPAHAVARALIRAAGVPVAAPSANRSTEVSPTRAEHVARSLGGRIDLILDGGPCPGGIESTVLDVTEAVPRLLRPGLVSQRVIEDVIGPISALAHATTTAVERSPGQMAKHYSPRKPVTLLTGAAPVIDDETCYLALAPCGGGHVVPMPTDPVAYAAVLYDRLHAADADPAVARIAIELPPASSEWVAVSDRLIRAAGSD